MSLGALILPARKQPRPPTSRTLFSEQTQFTQNFAGQALDLSGLTETYRTDFNQPITDASGSGPLWTAVSHTFIEDSLMSQYSYSPPRYILPGDGTLIIRGSLEGSNWRSGLIQSVGPQGQGFSQSISDTGISIFEMRAKLPSGDGVWPAFWPYSIDRYLNPTAPRAELDCMEWYTDTSGSGTTRRQLHAALNFWQIDNLAGEPGHESKSDIVDVGYDITNPAVFHVFSVEVTYNWMVFYVDGIEITRHPMMREWERPLYLQANLQLRSGFKNTTPGPVEMVIDYMRALK